MIWSLATIAVVGFVQFTHWAPLPVWLIPVGLALLLWRRPRSLRFVETAGFVWMVTLWLSLLYRVLFTDPVPQLEQLTSVSPWLPVAMGVAFVLFRPRRAMWSATGIFLASLGLSLAYILKAGPDPQVTFIIRPLLQIVMANGVLVGLFYFQARIRVQSDKARTIAQSMASLAHTDPLLGIPNRRQVHALIQHEIRMAEEGVQPASLIMFDLDRFKEINDTFGHETGDHVLKAVTDAIKQTLRSSDRIGRWGGDEFIVLVGTCDLAQANLLAERLGEVVYQRLRERFIRLTISLGVAAYHPGDTVETWVDRADQALYRAKKAGRNRVMIGS